MKMAVQVAKPGAPRLWVTFLREFCGVDERLAIRLWQKLYPSERQPLSLQLARLQDSHAHELSIQNFRALLTPKLLLALCHRLSPEDGRERRPDVVEVEERILERTTGDGEWI